MIKSKENNIAYVDGDYKMLVDFLIEEKKIKKMLFQTNDSRHHYTNLSVVNFLSIWRIKISKEKLSTKSEQNKKGSLGTGTVRIPFCLNLL